MKTIPDDFPWEDYHLQAEKAKIIRAGSLTDAVLAAEAGGESSKGALLPWEKSVDRMRIRAGEVTVWGGYNGHWKSVITTQVALGLMRQREAVLIASFEMLPVRTLRRMVGMAAGTDQPALGYIRAFHRWCDADRLWLFDHYGYCEPQKMIAVANYAARQLGVRHVVIDSLMKCVSDPEDYSGQKIMVGDLCSLAMQTGLHVHLIAHAKKCADENAALNRYGLMGSGGVSDQADNVVLVQRNKRKEREAEKPEGSRDAVVLAEPDVFLRIDKQRHVGFEGTIGLYLDRKAFAFADTPGGHAKPLNLPVAVETAQNDPQAA